MYGHISRGQEARCALPSIRSGEWQWLDGNENALTVLTTCGRHMPHPGRPSAISWVAKREHAGPWTAISASPLFTAQFVLHRQGWTIYVGSVGAQDQQRSQLS